MKRTTLESGFSKAQAGQYGLPIVAASLRDAERDAGGVRELFYAEAPLSFRVAERRGYLGLLLVVLMALPALAQPAPPPGANLPKAEPPKPAPGAPPQAQPVEQAEPSDDISLELGPFTIKQIELQYATDNDALPAVAELMAAQAPLRETPMGWRGPRAGQPSSNVKLADLSTLTQQKFYGTALVALLRAVQFELNRRGLSGVQVEPHQDDIDLETGEDLRKPDQGTLRLVIRTVSLKGIRVLPAGLQEYVTGGVDDRIARLSPLKDGDLFRKDLLDDYVYRLNRHPGRRVDAAIAPGIEDGTATLDYLVRENKPWFVFAQVSNTGTETTNEWRERFGFTTYQLTGNDDMFSIDYVTAGFDASHAVIVSYNAPFFDSQTVRWKVDGTWSQYDASEVGQALEEFSGEDWDISAQLSFNIYQHRELFIDLFAGVKFQYIKVENQTLGDEGDDYFFVPFGGVSVERYTDIASTQATVSLEGNLADVAGTDFDEIQFFGRTDPSTDFAVLRWSMSHAFYLEPLFNPDAFGGAPIPRTSTLAHEIAVSFRGQYTFEDRVVPQYEQVIGGRYTVRGYEESLTAGDTALVFSFEYRYHLPRGLDVGPPSDTPFGSFKWRPQEAYDRPDWDLVLRGFVDVGHTIIADPLDFEEDETLVGAGVGLELLIKQNFSLQLDFGVALTDVGPPEAREAEAGDTRLHVVATIYY